jgi:hypothetical protein
MEHDAADRSCYPLAIDQDNSTPINFAESINFSPFQKIRTHRRIEERVEAVVQLRCIEANEGLGPLHRRRTRSHACERATRLRTTSLATFNTYRASRLPQGGVTWADLHPYLLEEAHREQSPIEDSSRYARLRDGKAHTA